MDTHFPHFPPDAPWNELLLRRDNAAEEREIYADMLFTHRERWAHPDPAALRVINDLYDAEVLGLDQELRVFFAELDKRALLQDSLVLITADHGEEFLDHGRNGHGHSLYNELIRVPLLLLDSRAASRTDNKEVVSLIDIGPTLLDRLGITVPAQFEGRVLPRRSLMSYALTAMWELIGNRAAPAAYSELLAHPQGPHEQCVIVDSRKLIIGPQGNATVYDLVADPNETNPDGLDAPAQMALRKTMQSIRERLARNVVQPVKREIDAQTRERLRALGYTN